MNRSRAFTLIELMVVILILAIIAAVAFPTYQHYKQKAIASTTFSAVAATSDAKTLYLIEHGDLDGISVSPDGGELVADNGSLGVEYPQMENVLWEIRQAQSSVDANRMAILTLIDSIPGEGCLVIEEFGTLNMTPRIYTYTTAENNLGLNSPGIEDKLSEYGVGN